MAQPQPNSKIEELRLRIKADPKGRLFYPLAEELRKVSRFDEAEQVLRAGLQHHPTYLSAWVSLGRVLREQHKDGEAVEALKKSLQLDPGNVVAARLLADAHLSMGDKLEALKKYKLVHALLPADQDLLGTIERLDREINPPFPAPAEPPPPPPADEETPFPAPAAPLDETKPASVAAPAAEAAAATHLPTMETPFAEAEEVLRDEQQRAVETGDAEPMFAAHAESPFEETASYTAASLTIEAPQGMHVEPAPLGAEVATVIEEESPFAEPEPEPAADVFAPAEPVRAADDLTNTLTMADLYTRQGLVDDARQIYENILQRDPANDDVRAKLDALAPLSPNAAKVAKLESWLSKVKNV